MRRNSLTSALAGALTAGLTMTAAVAVWSPVLAQPKEAEVTVRAPPRLAPGTEIKNERVKVSDLDLNHEDGAETLVGRIRAAATRVCMPLPHHRTAYKDIADYQKCRSGAMEGAVREVGSPMVDHVFERTGD